MERKTQFNVGYLLFALFAMILVQQWWQTAQTVEVNVPEVPKLGTALAGRPKWVAGRPHRETRSGAW